MELCKNEFSKPIICAVKIYKLVHMNSMNTFEYPALLAPLRMMLFPILYVKKK